MLALQCDRCSKYFALIGDDKPDRLALQQNDEKAKFYFTLREFDLCPYCMDELIWWLENKRKPLAKNLIK